ncbi:MAG: phosphoribosyltransferase, partial [Gammaproteobacteria bacterium]|nr:phosphoribosyltransferase [Gammaproteobacteria bacterium]
MFQDRKDAGERLAGELQRFEDAHPVILALPRGGVPVGYEIARALGAPLDLVLVRKIGMPGQPELALGAVADGGHPETVINEDVVALGHVPPEYVEEESKRQLEEIERRRQRYLGERRRIDVKGRTAIVVDDGV